MILRKVRITDPKRKPGRLKNRHREELVRVKKTPEIKGEVKEMSGQTMEVLSINVCITIATFKMLFRVWREELNVKGGRTSPGGQ